MAALTFKVGGDTSALGSSMRRARGMLGGLAGMGKKMALGGLAVGMAGAATAMTGLAVAGAGVKKALDLGGALSDLSSRTGVAVGELAVLQQAFVDNGLSAEKVGPIMNKMQKGISDASNGLSTQVRALQAMGLEYEDLAGKSPLEQFEMLQKGLAGIEDVTLRTGAAMDIFGRSGGELQALFDDAGAMDKASATIGGQADILERNAAAFDRSSDLLKSMGTKLQGLFVGMADYINPVLLPVLEKLDKMDLAKYGQAVGRFVSTLAEAFTQGKLMGLLKDGLVVAAKEFVNVMVNGMKGMVGFLAAALPQIATSMWSKMQDPQFWDGLKLGMQGVGYAFEEIIQRALGKDDKADLAKAWSENSFLHSGKMINRSGDGQAIGDMIGKAMADGAAAFGRQMEQDGPLGTGAERKRIADTMAGLRKAVEERKDQEDEAAKAPPAKPPGGLLEEALGGAGGALRPIVSSLGRVGGAALIAQGNESMDRQRNTLLKKIERNTRGPGVGLAVFG